MRIVGYDILDGTMIGSVCVAARDKGTCAVLISDRGVTHPERLHRMFPNETVMHAPDRVRRTRRELEAYFAGEQRTFSGPIDLGVVKGDFQRMVLERLVEVPFGQLVTYGELAASVGAPGAARAVGVTMANNPIAIVVPCHRVVSSTGLGGYSGGGVVNKRALLALEGVSPPELFQSMNYRDGTASS